MGLSISLASQGSATCGLAGRAAMSHSGSSEEELWWVAQYPWRLDQRPPSGGWATTRLPQPSRRVDVPRRRSRVADLSESVLSHEQLGRALGAQTPCSDGDVHQMSGGTLCGQQGLPAPPMA